jgi:hypothetical protein
MHCRQYKCPQSVTTGQLKAFSRHMLHSNLLESSSNALPAADSPSTLSPSSAAFPISSLRNRWAGSDCLRAELQILFCSHLVRSQYLAVKEDNRRMSSLKDPSDVHIFRAKCSATSRLSMILTASSVYRVLLQPPAKKTTTGITIAIFLEVTS